jgi:hypothetical protein
LRHSLDALHLDAGIVRQLESNVAKLGNLSPPNNVDSKTASTIRSAIVGSFIFGFRVIMLLCAALSTASAAVAWRKIPGESVGKARELGNVAPAK